LLMGDVESTANTKASTSERILLLPQVPYARLQPMRPSITILTHAACFAGRQNRFSTPCAIVGANEEIGL